MYALGKTSLGLAYGLGLAETALSPAMPSTTARAGGVFVPIIISLARNVNSFASGFSAPLSSPSLALSTVLQTHSRPRYHLPCLQCQQSYKGVLGPISISLACNVNSFTRGSSAPLLSPLLAMSTDLQVGCEPHCYLPCSQCQQSRKLALGPTTTLLAHNVRKFANAFLSASR